MLLLALVGLIIVVWYAAARAPAFAGRPTVLGASVGIFMGLGVAAYLLMLLLQWAFQDDQNIASSLLLTSVLATVVTLGTVFLVQLIFPAIKGGPAPTFIYRHPVLRRITHWVNVIAITFLVMSGLQIFNARPDLYWGNQSNFASPILSLRGNDDPPHGETTIFGWTFDTTGVLGASRDADGDYQAIGFPHWATVPGYRDLATGRRWHFFFAWIFVINGAIYLISSLLSRHVWRDLLPSREQLRNIGPTILHHMRLKFPHERDYNVLQKLVYLVMIFGVLPLIVLAGLVMSPGMDAAFPWLVDLFGGRQTARTIHFICATLVVLFVIVHVALVLVSGVWNNIRSMFTGKYQVDTEASHG
jgi:thiosulfate reductase cytochrome b subunit